jgi:hypothetical protein
MLPLGICPSGRTEHVAEVDRETWRPHDLLMLHGISMSTSTSEPPARYGGRIVVALQEKLAEQNFTASKWLIALEIHV